MGLTHPWLVVQIHYYLRPTPPSGSSSLRGPSPSVSLSLKGRSTKKICICSLMDKTPNYEFGNGGSNPSKYKTWSRARARSARLPRRTAGALARSAWGCSLMVKFLFCIQALSVQVCSSPRKTGRQARPRARRAVGTRKPCFAKRRIE